MGYHVYIVRTKEADGGQSSSILASEVIETAPKLGFEIRYKAPNQVELISKMVGDEEATLFFSDAELLAKNPSDAVIGSMLDLARALGNQARVRGDEGETYMDATTTYTHPHDRQLAAPASRFYWKDFASWIIPVLGGTIFLIGVGNLIFKFLAKKLGG